MTQRKRENKNICPTKTISVPIDLRKKINKRRDVNWSAVACNAFRIILGEEPLLTIEEEIKQIHKELDTLRSKLDGVYPLVTKPIELLPSQPRHEQPVYQMVTSISGLIVKGGIKQRDLCTRLGMSEMRLSQILTMGRMFKTLAKQTDRGVAAEIRFRAKLEYTNPRSFGFTIIRGLAYYLKKDPPPHEASTKIKQHLLSPAITPLWSEVELKFTA